jgi:hypothetical protein
MEANEDSSKAKTGRQKRRFLIIVICIVIALTGLMLGWNTVEAGVAYGWHKMHFIDKIQIPKDTKVWLISTANYGVGTGITFLDKDLKTLATSPELHYSTFAYPPQIPVVRDHVLYNSPQGDISVSASHITVSIDMRSGEIREYNNGKEMSGPCSTAVNRKAFYVGACRNGSPVLSRRDRKTGEITYRRFDKNKETISFPIIATDRTVYFAETVNKKNRVRLYLLDPDDLSTRKIIMIPNEPEYLSEYDGKIYMPLYTGGKFFYIGIVDDETGEFKKIRLKGRDPQRILKYGRYLITDDTDLNRDSTIILYDTKAGRETNYHFDGEIYQTWMDQDTLYVFDDKDYENSRITVYQLRSGSLKKVRSRVFNDQAYSSICTANGK